MYAALRAHQHGPLSGFWHRVTSCRRSSPLSASSGPFPICHSLACSRWRKPWLHSSIPGDKPAVLCPGIRREEGRAATASRFSGLAGPCALRNGGSHARGGWAAWDCPRALMCADVQSAAPEETSCHTDRSALPARPAFGPRSLVWRCAFFFLLLRLLALGNNFFF